MIIGIDEVGRGAFAGPLVAAAVVIDSTGIALSSRLRGQKDAILSRNQNIIIRDSKKMTKLARERTALWIHENCKYSIGLATVDEINTFGIVEANQLAFSRALEIFSPQDHFLYADAYQVLSWPQNKQVFETHGEDQYPCIAAASIVAKVYRDRYMSAISHEFPQYDWDKNVGYGTKAHRNALKIHGASMHHRELFIRQYV